MLCFDCEPSCETFNKFSCPEGKLISRVPVGKFTEYHLGNQRGVFIDVYKLPVGYVLWNEWDFISVDACTPDQVQQIIEGFQDEWNAFASLFVGYSESQAFFDSI